jgi:Ser/Thr protein kinase RdoA (MazF antagonist)
MSSTDEVLRAAAEALSHWRDDVVGVELLSATENLVCGARTGDGDRLVVRLHRPGYTSLTELRSEVVWVDALAGSGLAVPVPLALPAGDHHVEVGVGAERRFASVVSWVAGRPLAESLDDATDSNIAGWYRSLGEAAAHIRRHATEWTPPSWFDRRHWNADGLMGDSPHWGPFWESPVLDDRQRRLFAAARDSLHCDLSELASDPARYGLIHADLHIGNVMLHESELTVIDFDDAGYGFHGHELAVAVRPLFGTAWFDTARQAMAHGYRNAVDGAEEDIALIDTFIVVRQLMNIGWLDARPDPRMPARRAESIAVAETSAQRFLDTAGKEKT